MEELIKISKIVKNSHNLKTVLPVNYKSRSLEAEFLIKLENGEFVSDYEAAQYFYRSDNNDVKYKMLKHRLKKKLYNKLFFVDFSKVKSKPFYEKEHECISLLLQARVLLRQNENELSSIIAKKAYNIAVEYDFTSFKAEALELILTWLTEKGDLKKFKITDKELRNVYQLISLEREAVGIYQLVMINTKKSIKSRKAFLPQLPSLISRTEQIWDQTKAYMAFNSYYRLFLLFNEFEGSFDKVIDLAIQAEEWLKEGKINTHRFDSRYNKFILVYSHLRAKNYEKGLEYAEQYLDEFDSRSRNWFAYMENYFLLALHARKYQIALNLLFRVNSNPSMSEITNAAKERWMLYRSYLDLVFPNQHMPQSISAFLSALPEYSKDKQGFNVAILIYQFILYLNKADIEGLIYRIESLKKYILTHLKDNFSLRSRLFLKLLMLTVTENYDPKQCRIKGQSLYQRLQHTPSPGDAYAEIEIIPYEYLWEHILSILEKKQLRGE
ncbi:hypothetical protein [Pontibacter sp. SGAir0037]|uniref:hypothetical protein n=1 Tax=Pontibacter sp. SGAir0037 TaxID=2571030 RepID=UPI0010CD3B3E|nr:hypothetical protein [Pontibacter sp. SGAir0037]QCR21705.1 hypothetical protein C1N53_04665 [Pontibacter sp. SGAir0037]